MTARIVRLLRYPVKSLGLEEIGEATLTEGQTFPWDRTWAVTHEHTRADGTEWARCLNFLRVASSPLLAAVRAKLDPATETLTLTHPDRPDLTVAPDTSPKDLVDWAAPLTAEGRAAPKGVVRVPGRGMTDSSFPSISIANMASHRAVEQKAGHDLSLYRWRSNIWLDGLAPWQEFEWVGRDIGIGAAVLRVEERIERCLNVLANPETGRRDHDLLAVLKTWGHQEFSVAATVIQGGRIAVGDGLDAA